MKAKKTFQTHSKFQDITLLENNDAFALYLDKDLQFFSGDEYRYHEALVHPVMTEHKLPTNVLILGGGDGLATREVLKYSSVDSVTIVDIDKEVTKLCKSHKKISALNEGSLSNKKVKVINEDAKEWLKNNQRRFDVVIVDFPDPNMDIVADLYTEEMFKLIGNSLAMMGCGAIQCGSLYKSPEQFWCLINTAVVSGLFMLPYHTNVPSFNGEWGFSMFGNRFVKVPFTYDKGVKIKSFDDRSSAAMVVFPPDFGQRSTSINTEQNKIIKQYYLQDNKKYEEFPDEIG